MIFVFSGTGNSYSVAKRVSEELGTGMVDIAAAVRYKRWTYDGKNEAVGFVFPTYFYGLPSMVRELASNVQIRNPGRTFCIATCGEESGGACDQLSEMLGTRLKIDSCYDVVMPDNAVFFVDSPSKDEAERILASADEEVGEIIKSIKSDESGDLRKHKGDKDWRELYQHYDEDRVTEPFRITDACIECRICEDVCPEQIIKVYHRKPVWDEEKCSLCMGCIQMCPKRAIEYGDSTASRGRYYNPAFYERTIGIPLKYRGRRPFSKRNETASGQPISAARRTRPTPLCSSFPTPSPL